MRQLFLLPVILTILLFSTLASTVVFSNYWYIQVSAYFGFAFGVCMTIVLINSFIGFRKLESIEFSLNFPDICILAWMLYYVVSFFLSTKYNHLPNQALVMLMLFSTYLYIRRVLSFTSLNNVIYLYYVIVLIGSVESIYGILQLLNILPNISNFKLGGSFGNPGDLANFLSLTYIVTLGLFFITKKRNLKLVLFVTIVFQLIVIIFSSARTAWIASGLLSIVAFWYFRFRFITIKFIVEKIKVHKFFSLIAFFCILFACISVIIMLYKFKPTSADGRIFMNKLSKELILEKPFFGHGYNSFFSVQHQKQMDYFKHNPTDSINGWVATEVVFAFNDYLQLAIEFGCILLILIFTLLLRLFSFRESFNSTNKQYPELLFIGRVTLGSILISMLFSYPLQNPTIFLCFFILISCISIFDKKEVYTLKVKKATTVVSATFALIFVCLITVYSIESMLYGLKWKHASNLFTKNKKESLLQYENINSFLKHDISFVFNYGSILFDAGEYRKCVKYYEKNMYLCQTSDIFLMMGQSYEELIEYKKAEESYKNASYISPIRFIPKYRLFKLYQKTGNEDMATIMANDIKKMKIKVYSDPVRNIKTEVSEYLSSKCISHN